MTGAYFYMNIPNYAGMVKIVSVLVACLNMTIHRMKKKRVSKVENSECYEAAVDHTNFIYVSNPGNSGGRKENVNAVDIIEILDVDDQDEEFDNENENPN